MDELHDQLRQLGQAAEADTTPVTAGAVIAQSEGTNLDLPSDIGREHLAASPARNGGRFLAAAAAIVLLAAGSAIFIGRDTDEPADLQTASFQTETVTPFQVPADDNGWEAVRQCESTGDYTIDTGNTFYGAYQFTLETFRVTAEPLGLDQYANIIPVAAPPEIQDAVANALFLERGADPWPVCGRFFQGPQITPVVPQWIGQTGRSQFSTIIFLDPDIGDGLADLRDELEPVLGSALDSAKFVDQEQAYEEFQAQFADNPPAAGSVSADDMPASFQLRDAISRNQWHTIKVLDGVFEIIESDPSIRFDPPPPMKISIPAIRLDAPVYPSATTENLGKGPAVLGGNAFVPLIAGFGSVDGSVFENLDDLRDGDVITVTTLVLGEEHRNAISNVPGSEVTRTYRVIGVGDDAPEAIALDELPVWSGFDVTGLTLVADVSGDPLLRLVVTAELVTPETQGYGIGSDN